MEPVLGECLLECTKRTGLVLGGLGTSIGGTGDRCWGGGGLVLSGLGTHVQWTGNQCYTCKFACREYVNKAVLKH